MSATTGALAQAAEDLVMAARRCRAAGETDAAAANAQLAIQRFLDCANAADDRRPDDANDLARAGAAASQATDFLGPGQRGFRPLPAVAARGAWREPGWRATGGPVTASERDEAIKILDKIAAKRRGAAAQGRVAEWVGRRADARLASTAGGFRFQSGQR